MKLILGSSSPARKMLLSRLGLEFTTSSPDIDESPKANESPIQLVKRLAVEKARAVAAREPNALIISSDQVIVLNNLILGKPKSMEQATKQLCMASSQRAISYTSLCLFDSNTQNYQLDVERFDVVFRKLTVDMARNYLNKESDPLHAAGAIKAECLGPVLFDALEGKDPNALTGLPLIKLTRMLEKSGVKII